jgi:hypothetical protein
MTSKFAKPGQLMKFNMPRRLQRGQGTWPNPNRKREHEGAVREAVELETQGEAPKQDFSIARHFRRTHFDHQD